jgi:tetratricopeptide (TPR) repeat protein
MSPIVAALRDASMLPGNDVFTDMRLALSLVADPSASAVFQEMQKAAKGTARATGEAAAKEIEAAVFIERLMKAPIKSFVGEGSSPVNDELLKAESLMQLGQFYDAAKRYERASVLDPVNPLPLIGRGHALLAAGDYLSASLFLIRGLERFPEMSRFEVDLRSFLRGGEIIDIRRADLMKELDRRDDPTLRFLLGYLEYFTGDRSRGLGNLERAAESAEPGTIIKRYPAMLRGEGPLPLPKMPAEGEAAPPSDAQPVATPEKEPK